MDIVINDLRAVNIDIPRPTSALPYFSTRWSNLQF